MDMDQATQAGSTALRTARFEYAAQAPDYDTALRRFTWGTWPGRTAMLWLPILAAAAAGLLRVWLWHLGWGGVVLVGVTLVVASLGIRQWHRRFRMKELYAKDAALGTIRTTFTEDGMRTRGAADGGQGEGDGWRGYPWWFETPELFVLTGSMGYFFVLPKRGAATPEDIDRARALFTEHLRRI
ncbi:YcxB family protein [Streptomyces sp. NPDC059385]|uniref:YcxB family protein n=1 Tax=Streptomyces sp. NPDC059385 TaxID=3346817 RepID=UPI00368D037A